MMNTEQAMDVHQKDLQIKHTKEGLWLEDSLRKEEENHNEIFAPSG
jgi:hypothetical protein